MPKLRPLWTPGSRGGGSGRDASVPVLVTSPLANGVPYFQDFFDVPIANAGFASGATATPDTLINLAPLGGPGWIATESGAGTTGNVALITNTNSAFLGCGLVTLLSGTAAANAVHLDKAGLLDFGFSNAIAAVGQWRVGWPTGNLAGANHGFGWVGSTPAVGVNWLTDPNTTLAATSALVFTRHEAVYAGSPAGDLVARLYDSAGTYNASQTLVASASLAVNVGYKIEAFFDAAALGLKIFVNEALTATFPLTGLAALKTHRPSAITTNVTNARNLYIDSYFQEVQRATAR